VVQTTEDEKTERNSHPRLAGSFPFPPPHISFSLPQSLSWYLCVLFVILSSSSCRFILVLFLFVCLSLFVLFSLSFLSLSRSIYVCVVFLSLPLPCTYCFSFSLPCDTNSAFLRNLLQVCCSVLQCVAVVTHLQKHVCFLILSVEVSYRALQR